MHGGARVGRFREGGRFTCPDSGIGPNLHHCKQLQVLPPRWHRHCITDPAHTVHALLRANSPKGGDAEPRGYSGPLPRYAGRAASAARRRGRPASRVLSSGPWARTQRGESPRVDTVAMTRIGKDAEESTEHEVHERCPAGGRTKS